MGGENRHECLCFFYYIANHLTDRVAKRFAESLRENRTLWHLDLSHNEIGEDGAVYLGAGLVCIPGDLITEKNTGTSCQIRIHFSIQILNFSCNILYFVFRARGKNT